MSKMTGGVLFGAIVIVVAIALAIVQSGYGVGIKVGYDTSSCSADYPLLVRVTNRLPISLNSYTFTFNATRVGHSSEVRNDTFEGSDKILPGWSTSLVCVSAPSGYAFSSERKIAQGEFKYGSLAKAGQVWAAEDAMENPALIWSASLHSAVWAGGLNYN